MKVLSLIFVALTLLMITLVVDFQNGPPEPTKKISKTLVESIIGTAFGGLVITAVVIKK